MLHGFVKIKGIQVIKVVKKIIMINRDSAVSIEIIL